MSARILTTSGAAVLLLVAACSSNKPSGSGGSSQPPASSGAAGGAFTISATGATLTGPNGRTLYANTVDTVTKITCIDACVQEWPPVTGTATAGNGVDASKFGTATRPDGTTQVTYDGHPLYEFAEDKKAGDMKGEGIKDEGGKWHVATVSGTPGGATSSTVPASGEDSSSAPSGGDSASGSSTY
jgi:predicted lipoprotein with Yx(FWY)xxD motif